MQPFHDTLVQFFSKNFAFEIARLPNVSFNSSPLSHPNFPASISNLSDNNSSIFQLNRNDSIASSVSNQTVIPSNGTTPQSRSTRLPSESPNSPNLNGRSISENALMITPIPMNGISPKSKRNTSTKNRGSVLGSLRWKKKDVIDEDN